MDTRPGFMDSPFFVMEVDNWHLLPGAPAEVQSEFDAWKQEQAAATDGDLYS